MVSTRDLVIIEKYMLLNEQRYRICVKGTNITVNVEASSEEEALSKALEILRNVKLTSEALEKIRAKTGGKAKC
ncbi:MAG: hypothetical protein OWQ48_05955 [Desulfurococcus sp.]|nr:hypothetical protein [Desulfurococcus sp.]